MLRAGLLSGMIAVMMGMPQDFVDRVVWSATLHDMGKTKPDILAVVNKPGRLDEAERAVMQEHTTVGAKMIAETFGLDPMLRSDAARVALEHHETMDGTGYPNKRPAAELFVQSRITAVADFLDALMENRPYRDGMSLEKAISIMSEEAHKLDPFAWKALRALVSTVMPAANDDDPPSA